jgi:hypothetical protein
MLGLESLVVAGDDLAEEAVVAASPTVRSGASAKLVTKRKSKLPELLGRSRTGGYVSVDVSRLVTRPRAALGRENSFTPTFREFV